MTLGEYEYSMFGESKYAKMAKLTFVMFQISKPSSKLIPIKSHLTINSKISPVTDSQQFWIHRKKTHPSATA